MDLDGFWDDNEYSLRDYVAGPPSDEMIASVEAELGYRLPASYVALMRSHNGGMLRRTCWAAPSSVSINDHVGVHAILGIGRDRECSLVGEAGASMADLWGYPAIGVYFADCPSAGHDMIAFDYRDCGPDGEPRVVHVDQTDNYRITVLAPDFMSFVRALHAEEDHDIEHR